MEKAHRVRRGVIVLNVEQTARLLHVLATRLAVKADDLGSSDYCLALHVNHNNDTITVESECDLHGTVLKFKSAKR